MKDLIVDYFSDLEGCGCHISGVIIVIGIVFAPILIPLFLMKRWLI